MNYHSFGNSSYKSLDLNFSTRIELEHCNASFEEKEWTDDIMIQYCTSIFFKR